MACRPSTRPTVAGLLALALLLVAPALARADCAARPLDRTFLPWLDPALYEAAPDGGFENGAAGWALSGGAAVMNGNDAYLVGARSLSLPAGSSATSAPVCVDLAHPTIRFFARGGEAPLAVSVLFSDPLGRRYELAMGTVAPGASWQPTLPLAVVGNLAASSVAFHFSSAGDWQIDDVFVDPYSKG